MEKLKVSQVAVELGITATAVYRKFKTSSEEVRNEITKENGITYLSKRGLDLLKASFPKTVPETLSHGSEPVQNHVQNLEKQVASQQGIISGLQATIDRLITQQGDERTRTDTIIMKLSNDIQAMQKALEFNQVERVHGTPREEGEIQAEPEAPRADLPRFVPPPAPKLPPVQRDTTAWEGIKMAFDDVFGFAFGRG